MGKSKPSPTNPRPTRRRLLPGGIVVAVAVVAALGAWKWWPSPRVDIDELVRDDLPAVVPGTTVNALEDDAGEDGWDSEIFGQKALGQLKALGKLLGKPDDLDAAALESVADADFASAGLRPDDLREIFRDDAFIVTRSPRPGSPADRSEAAHRSRAGLFEAAKALVAPYRPREESEPKKIRSKFKVFRVQLEGGSSTAPPRASTRVYVQLNGPTRQGTLQINATWRCRWLLSSPAPLLTSIVVEAYEEVAGLGAGSPLFADCTEAILGGNEIFDKQLRPGIDHWTGIVPLRFGIDIGGWQGLALGDVNGDGLDDLYVCQPGGLPNRLFVQNADGTATETSAAAGVDWLESTHGALLVDIDNDGDQDLLAGVEDGILIQQNDGKGRFEVAAAKVLPAAYPYSLAAADYDEDGDLDLYVCCYDRRQGINRHIIFARPVPYHDANNGGRNVLLRNDGNWRFTYATRRVGLDVNNRRFSYAAAWEDYDNDGDLDLYVANDFGRNNLYRNDGGKFTDAAAAAGVEDISPGMSACWGDYDNDGLPDLYVSNMFSSAGNRIAFQGRFHAGATAATLAEFQRHARGNSLFRNLGDGTFRDVSVEAGVTIGRWAWGSKFADLNNDGWQDLVVTNGFITQEDTGDL